MCGAWRSVVPKSAAMTGSDARPSDAKKSSAATTAVTTTAIAEATEIVATTDRLANDRPPARRLSAVGMNDCAARGQTIALRSP
jgi:hypothetical protein